MAFQITCHTPTILMALGILLSFADGLILMPSAGFAQRATDQALSSYIREINWSQIQQVTEIFATRAIRPSFCARVCLATETCAEFSFQALNGHQDTVCRLGNGSSTTVVAEVSKVYTRLRNSSTTVGPQANTPANGTCASDLDCLSQRPNFFCQNGTCQCPYDTHVVSSNGTACLTREQTTTAAGPQTSATVDDGPCTSDQSCTLDPLETVCRDGLCQCPPDTHVVSSDQTTCLPLVKPKDACLETSQCNSSQLLCRNNTCQCAGTRVLMLNTSLPCIAPLTTQIYVTSTYILTYPSNGLQYLNNLDIWWCFSSPAGAKLRTRVNSWDVEAVKDYVQISDRCGVDASIMVRYNYTPSLGVEMTSTGNFLQIGFKTDSSIVRTGFSLAVLVV